MSHGRKLFTCCYFKNEQQFYRLVGVLVKDIAVNAKGLVLGVIPELVKSESVAYGSPSLRCFCAAQTPNRGDGSRHRLRLGVLASLPHRGLLRRSPLLPLYINVNAMQFTPYRCFFSRRRRSYFAVMDHRFDWSRRISFSTSCGSCWMAVSIVVASSTKTAKSK